MEAVAPLPRQPGSRAGLLLWGQPPLQSGLWVPAGKVTLAGGSDGVTSPGSWGCLKKPQLLLSPAPAGLVTGPTGPHLLTHPGHLVPRHSVSSPGPQAPPELTWPCPRGLPQPPPCLTHPSPLPASVPSEVPVYGGFPRPGPQAALPSYTQLRGPPQPPLWPPPTGASGGGSSPALTEGGIQLAMVPCPHMRQACRTILLSHPFWGPSPHPVQPGHSCSPLLLHSGPSGQKSGQRKAPTDVPVLPEDLLQEGRALPGARGTHMKPVATAGTTSSSGRDVWSDSRRPRKDSRGILGLGHLESLLKGGLRAHRCPAPPAGSPLSGPHASPPFQFNPTAPSCSETRSCLDAAGSGPAPAHSPLLTPGVGVGGGWVRPQPVSSKQGL